MFLRGLAVMSLLAGLTACASSPVSSSGAAAATASVGGISIGQCDDGVPRADIDYPAGWFERLSSTERRNQPTDELLGGLDTAPPPSDRDVSPDTPPAVTYPQVALANKIEGVCDVLFDTTPQGRPTNIVSACSNPLFLASATQAIAGVSVAPRIEDGQAVGRKGVVYPFLFCIE